MAKKNNNRGLVVGGLVLAGVGSLLLYRFNKNKTNPITPDGVQVIQVSASNIYALGQKTTGDGVSFSTDFTFKNTSSQPVTISIDSIKNLVSGVVKTQQYPRKTVTIPAGYAAKQTVTFTLGYKDALSGWQDWFKKGASVLTDQLKQATDRIKASTFQVSITSGTVSKNIDLRQNTYLTVQLSGFSGLALSAGKRDILDGDGFSGLIDQSIDTDILVNKNADVSDTVAVCHDIIKRFHKQTAKLADYLWKRANGDAYEFGKQLFAFCYGYMQYENDDMGLEQLRTPARSYRDRTRGVDCDDFSIFCASVLTCKGIPYKLRITKYDGKSYFQHIYCVATINGREVPIDPVIDRYDFEKKYSAKQDYKP